MGPNNDACTAFGWLILAAVLLLALRRRHWRGSGDAFGTARFANPRDLAACGMLDGEGLILGRTSDGQLIRLPPSAHNIAIIAPTGAGKNVSLVIPWLLTYPGGSVVLDPKGENYRLTSEQRRAMGQRVVRLDPFGVCGPGADAFNPLDLIGSGPDCVDEARAFAEAMVTRPPDGDRDPHWSDQAANALTAFLALVCLRLPRAERTLSSLRDLVTEPDACEVGATMLREMGGVFARLAGVLAQMQDKERAGVMSTLHRHSTWIDSPAIGAATSTSSFDVRTVLTGTVTLYLILPPTQMEAQARWLRVIVGALIRLIGREGMRPGRECLFVLDEAGQLGHMPPLEQGLTLLRGYGARMAFVFQSLTQLRSVFKDKEGVLLDNCAQIYFGTQSYETAERVSKMLGDATIVVESANDNTSRSWTRNGHDGQTSGQSGTSSGRNWSEHGRALLKPEEVLNLSGDYLLAFVKGVPPILARRILWYRDAVCGTATALPPLVWWVLLSCAVALLASTIRP